MAQRLPKVRFHPARGFEIFMFCKLNVQCRVINGYEGGQDVTMTNYGINDDHNGKGRLLFDNHQKML